MARILAVGSGRWSSQRLTLATLRKVMTVYRDPYVLVCDMGDGAPRFAAAAARSLGWVVEAHEIDPTKCAEDCPTENHRRMGGPAGSWCPTARHRNTELMLDSGIDLCLAFTRTSSREEHGYRAGQHEASRRDIGIWTVDQPRKAVRDADQTS